MFVLSPFAGGLKGADLAQRQHNQRIDGIRLIAHEVDGARRLGGGVAQRLQSRLL